MCACACRRVCLRLRFCSCARVFQSACLCVVSSVCLCVRARFAALPFEGGGFLSAFWGHAGRPGFVAYLIVSLVFCVLATLVASWSHHTSHLHEMYPHHTNRKPAAVTAMQPKGGINVFLILKCRSVGVSTVSVSIVQFVCLCMC